MILHLKVPTATAALPLLNQGLGISNQLLTSAVHHCKGNFKNHLVFVLSSFIIQNMQQQQLQCS